MEAKLKQMLHQYIVAHNPELMLKSSQTFSLQNYIEDKVMQIMPRVDQWMQGERSIHEIEAFAMSEMTMDLRPSKFMYLKKVFEEEFPESFQEFSEKGVLTHELVSILETCDEVFQAHEFSDHNTNSNLLRHAVIIKLHNYLP